MPRMTDVRSVAANSTVENVLTGKIHEFLPVNSLVRAMLVAAAVGLRATLIIGNEVLVNDQEVSGANRFPVYPDDVMVEGAGFSGDRIVLSLRNTTGGAITANTVVDTYPA